MRFQASRPVLLPLLLAAGSAASVMAQSSTPAVFATNNGNLRGSVTSWRINPNGSVTLVQDFVIGERLSSQPSIQTTNAYSGSLTPNGKYIAVGHATSFSQEQITILRVHEDATISLATSFMHPSTPLDLIWLSDSVLAVTESYTSGTNRVKSYRFNEGTMSVSLINSVDVGGFCSSLGKTPDGHWLFANSSPLQGSSDIFSLRVAADGTLSRAMDGFTYGYSLGLGMSPDGLRLFSGGGISGGNVVTVQDFNPETGALFNQAPYVSAGDSPKQVVVAPGGSFALVAHGTDGTGRLHSIDPATGALTYTGDFIDTGAQGSLGFIDIVRVNGVELALFTDRDTTGGRGMCSAVINPDGTITEISMRVDGGGVDPYDVMAWAPPVTCGSGDFNGDGDFGTDQDIEAFFACLSGNCCATCGSGDFNADGDFGTDQDIEAFFRVLSGGTC